jgi:hypothetical protein
LSSRIKDRQGRPATHLDATGRRHNRLRRGQLFSPLRLSTPSSPPLAQAAFRCSLPRSRE